VHFGVILGWSVLAAIVLWCVPSSWLPTCTTASCEHLLRCRDIPLQIGQPSQPACRVFVTRGMFDSMFDVHVRCML
jgi:hypothetical protein